jgi:hypothetical protein
MKFLITLAICLAVVYQVSGQTCTTTCFNGGVCSGSTCTCATGFNGPNCQFAINPCAQPDIPATCSNLNCWGPTTTSAQFWGCQAKCLCCANLQCANGGAVVPGANPGAPCSCKCFTLSASVPSKYDPATGCKTLLAGQACVDDARCATQFMVFSGNTGNCANLVVRGACPLTCGVCTPAVKSCVEDPRCAPYFAELGNTERCADFEHRGACPLTCGVCTLAGQSCVDDSSCVRQYLGFAGNTGNCAEWVVRGACPLTCGICTP